MHYFLKPSLFFFNFISFLKKKKNVSSAVVQIEDRTWFFCLFVLTEK